MVTKNAVFMRLVAFRKRLDENKKCEEQIKDLYSEYAVECVENQYNLKESNI